MKYLMTFLMALLAIELSAQPGDAQNYNANTRLAVASSNAANQTNMSWVVGGSLFLLAEDTSERPNQRTAEYIDGLKVYPNPTKDRLVVSYFTSDKGQSRQFTVGVFDLNGRELLRRPMLKHRVEIDLIALPSAMYLIKIFDKELGQIKSYKIIKN